MRRAPQKSSPYLWKRSELPRSKQPLKRVTTITRTPFPLERREQLNRVSKRRQRVNRTYAAFRRDFLRRHPVCPRLNGNCTRRTTDLHHVLPRGRSGRDSDLVDPENAVAACRNCHDWIELHRAEALALGLLKKARPMEEKTDG